MSDSTSLRIVFAGTPDFAAVHLRGILDTGKHQVIAVYTQPDRPAGRGKKLTPSPVKALALEHNIPVYQPRTLKDLDAQAELKSLNADLMVVVAYGLLLPAAVLEPPRLGCINVHASLLPRWRGAAPIQRAIEAGDTRSGVIIMQMDEGLDTGDMLLETRCDISPTETGGSLHDKLADMGVPALNRALNLLAQGDTVPKKQDDALSCYAPKISKSDLIIDWRQPAEIIERKIRAFNPFPIAYATLGGQRIKIWQADVLDQNQHQCTGTANKAAPGTIINVTKTAIIVCCGQGSLALKHIQLPGKKAMDVAAVLNSKADLFTVGTQFDCNLDDSGADKPHKENCKAERS